MGFLHDQLPPNVYILGNPQANDGYARTMSGLDVAMGAVNAISGRQIGRSTLGGAVASAAWSEVLNMDSHWCQIDLNTYTIGIDGSPMRPLADITYAEIRMPDAFLFGFSAKHWMGVTANQVTEPQKQLLKYILPFTGLPADSYVIDPAEKNVAHISKSHAQAYVDHFYS
jgi:hypothetical protein